jgi:hypothetical protein
MLAFQCTDAIAKCSGLTFQRIHAVRQLDPLHGELFELGFDRGIDKKLGPVQAFGRARTR